jgi:diguanylate cyclase (GGDEF)-like protein/PAS domain S-box-containing protein
MAAMAVTVALFALLAVWMFQPLARLRDRAGHLLDDPADLQGAMPWPRAGGEVGALVEVFEGVQGQRLHAQQRHRALERQYQALLEVSSVGIAITRGGQLESVNRRACQMLGYLPAQLQGQALELVYASELDSPGLDRRIQEAFAVHGGFDGDACLRRKDGSPVWVRVKGRAVDPQAPDGDRVWMVEEMTAVHEERRQGAWATTHDPLTQLENRPGFEQRLRQLLTAGPVPTDSRPGVLDGGDAPLALGVVLFLDLDHFTVINDVAGHDAGDDVLRHVARLLEAQVRQSGWAARLGGDEFAVVLPGCSPAHGMAVAEQLRAAVQGWEPVYQGRSFTLGVSIGMVALDDGLQDVAAVLHAADMACYDAKRAGRNQVARRSVPASMLA